MTSQPALKDRPKVLESFDCGHARKNIRSIQPTSSGFTLIELLVVISIIALLISILLPALGSARESAKEMQCASNMRNLGLGVFSYTIENNDHYPAQRVVESGVSVRKTWWFYQVAEHLALPGYTGSLTRSVPAWNLSRRVENDKQVFMCPNAVVGVERAGFSVPAVSYMVNSHVIVNPSFNVNNPIEYQKLDLLTRPIDDSPVPHKQMMLAEYLVGGTPWVKVDTHTFSARNFQKDFQVWDGQRLFNDVINNTASAKGQVMPWHGGNRVSNVLMADSHVEMGVDGIEGAEEHYQRPDKADDPAWQ